MNKMVRNLGLAAGLALGTVGFGVGAAQAEGATVLDCSLIEPGAGGTIVITPNGQLRANCHVHTTGAPTGGPATRIDCVEAIGIDGPGVAVITPSGNTLINCHVHQDL